MDALNAFEIEILLWLQSALANPVFDSLARLLAWLGDSGRVFIALALVLLIVKRTRIIGLSLSAALVLDLLAVNITIKPLVARVRPYDFSELVHIIVKAPSDFSFPSGHTAVAFAAAGALSMCGKKIYITALSLAALMGLSRIYLMVHYPTDVLAGAVIGGLCGLLAAALCKRFFNKSRREDL